jgi:alpha-L-fucosidase
MVNDRGGAGADFYTPEHNISYFNREQSWEACHTTTGQWGYNPRVGPKKIEQLMEILLYVWGGDGNVLLNIGPMGDGQVNPVERNRFEQLAEWWSVHGEESIRGSRGGPYLPGPWGAATCKDNRAFLHIFRWPEQGALKFPFLEDLKLKSARVLSGGEVTAKQDTAGIMVSVPEAGRGKILTTIELTFDGPVYPVKPLQRVASLTKQATLTSSDANSQVSYLADQNVHTLWEGKRSKGEDAIWIEASFDDPRTIDCFSVARGEQWITKSEITLEIPDGVGGWKDITPKGLKVKWETMKFLDEPVTTDRIRLNIEQAEKFLIAEFELFAPVE